MLEPDSSGRVRVRDLYIMPQGLIVALEIDPLNQKYLYLVDDYQNVYHIYENNEGKGIVQSCYNLEIHSLEDELKEVKKTPWA